LQDLDGPLGRSSIAKFKRDELRDQVFELAWQRLCQSRQIVGVQPTTYCGQ
jgi:hypothetical protein